MPFPYKKVLVIGATSGIGEAFAARLVKEGSSVIVTGRRKENLVDFVHKHGKDKATAVPFDVTEMDKIPNFVTKFVLEAMQFVQRSLMLMQYHQDPPRPRLRDAQLRHPAWRQLLKAGHGGHECHPGGVYHQLP